jgi:16S rRNA (cytidine1402-2'-O)-methyltransferase
MMKGTLYIIPTPIGNLGDLTLRVIKCLEQVDLIAAEDTRRTLQLLNHLKIKKPLMSYHDHNRRDSGMVIIEKVLSGLNVGVVSDAGMPGISDPGADLVKAAIENDIEIEVLPGPTAFVNALVLSGLDTKEFHFVGFLDRQKKYRRKKLETIKSLRCTLIFYESPHRLRQCLRDIFEVLGEREVSIARELTKKFEEVTRGTLSEVMEEFSSREIRGEFVIVISGNDIEELIVEERDPSEMLQERFNDGMKTKAAVKEVSEALERPKNEIYQLALELIAKNQKDLND